MTELWLVRHGQTDWNREQRYQGQADPPLNETGRLQARTLAPSLLQVPFTAIYSSDMLRAYETALILSVPLKLPVHSDARLREVHQGEWAGMLIADIQARYPDQWHAWEFEPPHARPPGGESLHELAQRVAAGIDDIVRRHPQGPLLIVSHGLAIATVLCRVRRLPLTEAFRLIPENATPHVIEVAPA